MESKLQTYTSLFLFLSLTHNLGYNSDEDKQPTSCKK